MSWPPISDAQIAVGRPVTSRLMLRYRNRDRRHPVPLAPCRLSWSAEAVGGIGAPGHPPIQYDSWATRFSCFVYVRPDMKGDAGCRLKMRFRLTLTFTLGISQRVFQVRTLLSSGGTDYPSSVGSYSSKATGTSLFVECVTDIPRAAVPVDQDAEIQVQTLLTTTAGIIVGTVDQIGIGATQWLMALPR